MGLQISAKKRFWPKTKTDCGCYVTLCHTVLNSKHPGAPAQLLMMEDALSIRVQLYMHIELARMHVKPAALYGKYSMKIRKRLHSKTRKIIHVNNK
jgi:hypothetical protein